MRIHVYTWVLVDILGIVQSVAQALDIHRCGASSAGADFHGNRALAALEASTHRVVALERDSGKEEKRLYRRPGTRGTRY